MVVGLLIYFLIVIGLQFITQKPEVTYIGAVMALASVVIMLTFITPPKMWRKDQRTIRAYRRRLKPRLALVFDDSKKPFLQENGLERQFRIGIRNESHAVISDVRVVIESCEPERGDIWIERPLHVMGQNVIKDRCSVSPGDRPTAYVNFLYQITSPDFTRKIEAKYASEGLPRALPEDIDADIVLRVEGGGTFRRLRLRARVERDGKLYVTAA